MKCTIHLYEQENRTVSRVCVCVCLCVCVCVFVCLRVLTYDVECISSDPFQQAAHLYQVSSVCHDQRIRLHVCCSCFEQG